LKQMNPGDEIEIVVRDPGAPTDLPAWCRMTGHLLISAAHPVYVIQRKQE
jgi:tRNA 2-thiouridine synthesizing protein A